MAIFTAVFYNSQCYQRYNSLYNGCMEIDMEVKVLVSELLSDFGFDPSLRRHILACVKYLIASAFFLHLSMAPDLQEEDWVRFTEKGLLSKKEVDIVRKFPCHTVLLLHHWVQQVAGTAAMAPPCKERYAPPERASMENRIYGHVDRLSAACCRISNTLNLPIPFPYFHLLQLLIVLATVSSGLLCCILVSKVSGRTYGLAVLPVAVMTFAMLALRRLAGELSDPFGEDGVDFPSYDFMRHIQDHCVAMLQADNFYDPMEGIDEVTEFEGWQVLKPCNPTVSDAPNQPHRSSRFFDVGEKNEHGARVWRMPEDFDSSLRLTRWLDRLERRDPSERTAAEGKPKESVVSAIGSVRTSARGSTRASARGSARRYSAGRSSAVPSRTAPGIPLRRGIGSMAGSSVVSDPDALIVEGMADEMLGPAKADINL